MKLLSLPHISPTPAEQPSWASWYTDDSYVSVRQFASMHEPKTAGWENCFVTAKILIQFDCELKSQF